MPVKAQVNWTALLNGKWGNDTCPPGHAEDSGNYLRWTNAASVGTDSVTFSTLGFALGSLRRETNTLAATRINVILNLYKNGTSFSGYQNLGAATAGTPVAPSTFTLSGLDSNTRYTAILHPSDDASPFAKACFRTGYADTNMNRKPDGNDLGKDSLGATGCFALGGERLGGGDAAIRACLCGARNRLGQWARTGTVEPGTNLTNDVTYKWIMPSTERTRQGCTTN